MAHEGQPRRKEVSSIPFLCRLKLAADGTLPAEHRRLRAMLLGMLPPPRKGA